MQTALLRAAADVPGRMIHFTNIDFDGVGSKDWIEQTVTQLAADVAAGAQGLKIYKSLGFDVRDKEGKRVAVDDPRLDPIWAKCGELGVPVLIHTGEQPHSGCPMMPITNVGWNLRRNGTLS